MKCGTFLVAPYIISPTAAALASFVRAAGRLNFALINHHFHLANYYYLALNTPINVLNALNNNGTRFIKRTVNTGSTTRFGREVICTGNSTEVTCPP
jgi:hypothetical protein